MLSNKTTDNIQIKTEPKKEKKNLTLFVHNSSTIVILINQIHY